MSKRSNGEGSFTHRSDGRWECSIMVGYGPDGKRLRKSFYGRTKTEVRQKLKQYQEDAEAGLKLDPDLFFSQWADIWLEGHRGNITATTYESYRYSMTHLKAWFGKMRLMDIKAADVENFLRDLSKQGKSDSLRSKCRGMLFQIMNKAEANDLIRKNPVRFAEKMRATAPMKRKEAFTKEEVDKLLKELPQDRLGYSIRLMLCTGIRGQELLALTPHHIEPDGSILHIRQAVKTVKGHPVIGGTKSFDSVRDVPVPVCARACALALRGMSIAEDGLIWEGSKKGQPIDPKYFRDNFSRYVGSVKGVRPLTPHSCRHTYVSQMQALGVDLQTIQSMVGHADTTMTEHYLHVQSSVKEAAVSIFNDAFRA